MGPEKSGPSGSETPSLAPCLGGADLRCSRRDTRQAFAGSPSAGSGESRASLTRRRPTGRCRGD